MPPVQAVHPDGSRWEVQFKGSGLTPYSRQADGRKVRQRRTCGEIAI
jgi:uncharacterized protein YdiU (UPF0061 family)